MTAFVIPVLLVLFGLSVFGPGGDDKNTPPEPAVATTLLDPVSPGGQNPGDSVTFERVFGRPGQIGFRVQFDRRNGCVRRVWLLDHEQLDSERAVEGEAPDYLIVTDTAETVASDGRPGVFPNLRLTPLASEEKFGGTSLDGAWEVEDLDDGVLFRLKTESGLVLERTYRWEPGRRDLLLEIAIVGSGERNDVGSPVPMRLGGVALPNPRRNYVLGTNPAVAVAGYLSGDEEVATFKSASQIGDEGGSLEPENAGARVLLFGGTTNRFFTAQLYPYDDGSADALRTVTASLHPSRYDIIAPDGTVDVPARTIPVARYDLGFAVPAAGERSAVSFRLYLGPKSKRVFASNPVAAAEYERLAAVADHDLQPLGCFCPIPGTQTTARFLLWVLGMFRDLVGNWGIAIVMLTICVRTALVPLNFRMQKAMRAYGAKMAKFGPEMERLKEQYKDDPKQQQMHLLQFQRENKLFPPVGGCLPMFVTIPIFIGLFSALRASYDLRGQSFFLWVDDLSQPDRLAMLPMLDVPFNLLPLLWCGLTFYLQSQAPLPKDPQQRQMMQIMRLMPLMFGVFLYNYASGLMVYMITSGMYALLEMRVVKKVLGPMPESPMGATPMPL